MSADLVAVPVPGTDVPMQASLVDGEPFVALKPMCEALGIDHRSQRAKLDQAKWAVGVMITATGSDGKTYRMYGLHADCIPMWLATIAVNRVTEHARPVLIAYQREAARALRDFFYRGVAVQPSGMSQLDVLRAALDQIEAAQRDAAEAKAIAQRADDRLTAIEGRHDWLSALAYARQAGLPTHTRYLRRLGKCAATIARRHGVEPNPVQHQLFGMVNSFPVWVWELAAERFEQ
ncbi:putative phage antirepressor [Bifidobacterium longum subsp. infantis ATCC = JCM 1222 = DSM 20088] [Mycobacterium shimoidei]|uniref:Putative phage antirepressor [Bifidobacterium longum subsp. infantis ATCC = JCM 1222 = DSM 20088] n=1 Tax=Mycobacterium shimoidei TaxID=29313 RepID=A0A375YXY1_MYCSH|nr:phage antirepressor N-terminal domain-containing protein [Mycobacterium shimoidei]SRX93605.1 putative phage antirepressor [Bifidobacterium longum subsp. infantis ATCC = JCM 1222 = DSM 20088] [Mycobacterium shimoidei]